MARFGPLAKLHFDHLYLIVSGLRGKFLRVKAAVIIAAPEITIANLINQIATRFAVLRANATFARIMRKTAHFCPKIEGGNRVGRQRAKRHGRNIIK